MEQNNNSQQPMADNVTGGPFGKVLQPSAGGQAMEAASINVGSVGVGAAVQTPNVPASNTQANSVYPEPAVSPGQNHFSINSSLSYTGSGSGIVALAFGVLSIVATFLVFTFGISINIWLKMAILVVLSVPGVVFGLKDFSKSAKPLALLGLIVSAFVLLNTLVIGSIYTYYYAKVHSYYKSLQNSTIY